MPRALIVPDASVVLEVLLQTEVGRQLDERLLAEPSLHVPHLLDLEVAQALRRYVALGDLSPERGEEALCDLLDLPFVRHSHDLLLPRVWELRHNLTAYDASYVALAELLEAPLLTMDRRMAGAPGLETLIEVV